MAQEERSESVSVITCDLEGVVQTFSEGASRLFGWKPEEVVGKQTVAIFHKPETVQELVPRLLKQAVEEGVFEEEVTLVRKDGSEFRAVLSVRPIYRDGKLAGYMGRTVRL